MKVIKSAVIGSGFMGSAHIEALRRLPGIRVTAIVSDDNARARELADHYDIEAVYEDWHDLMSTDVDVIHNCTPNYLHYDINKAALSAGKHVISEKPLTITSAESEELVRMADRNGCVNAVNYNYRFYPLIQHARKLREKGELGSVYLVSGHYLQDWLFHAHDYNWRLESGISGASRAVADIGSHWCDLIQFITGLKITAVCANLVTIHEQRRKPRGAVDTFKGKEQQKAQDADLIRIDTEDAATVMLRFDSGAGGMFTVSQVNAGRKNRFEVEIAGSRMAMAWNQEEPNQLWLGYRDEPNRIVIKDPALIDSGVRQYAHYPGGHPEGYPDGPKNLFMNVYQYIREGKKPGRDEMDFPTFEDGHLENRIVESILKSHKTRQWEEV